MSAWIVEQGHIDVLVQGMIEHKIIPMHRTSEVGAMLWAENHDSVNYCYKEETEYSEYAFRGVEAPLNLGAVLKAASCYEYQTCEHPTWDDSESFSLVMQLQEAVNALSVNGAHPDYIAAPWGFNSIEQAIERVV